MTTALIDLTDATHAHGGMTPDAEMDQRRRHGLLWFLVAAGAMGKGQAQAVSVYGEAAVPNPLPAIPDSVSGVTSVYDVLRLLTRLPVDNGRDAVPDPHAVVDEGLQRACAHVLRSGVPDLGPALSAWALSQLD